MHLTRGGLLARTLRPRTPICSSRVLRAASMSTTLPPTITQGILNFPGATPESKATAERLLEEDRQKYHCFWGKVGFHNHLSHHILAAYDLGASAKQLQAIYDTEQNDLSPIHLADRKAGTVEAQDLEVTAENWRKYLGEEKYYANYLKFFTETVARLGAGVSLEQYVFSPVANGDGASMLLRFVGGAVHPLIQTGYGVEFGSDAMVAQALAQTAVHSAFQPELFDLKPQKSAANGHHNERGNGRRQPSQGLSLLEILRQAYDSPILKPVMPYDNDAFIRQRFVEACKDGRPEEIVRLSNLWEINSARGQEELDERVEEFLWLATLLFAGSGKPGRKPRLDFFLMHILNASLFLPSLLRTLPTMDSRITLLRAFLPVVLILAIIRGRPRIKPELMMSYSAVPRPPARLDAKPGEGCIGDLREDANVNPWPEIIASVVHAPDAHTVKAVRSLYYAAQKYGTTPAGGAIGAFRPDGSETHEGIAKVDGTIFVRAAGVVMDTLGWVSHGQKEGSWDRSGLGWEDAWKNED